MPYDDDDIIDSKELARRLSVHERTVRRWRNESTGPSVLWAGNVARYRWGNVLAWLRRRDDESRDNT
jgi:hypothetical protein